MAYDSKGRTTKSTNYDYRTPKPRASFAGSFSRRATTICSYIDVYGPAIVAAYAPTEMPRVISIDTKPLKRRAWAANKAGAMSTVSNGERKGDIMVLAAGGENDTQAVPILAALEGGKDSGSWMRVFARLPRRDDDPDPFWVVADLDAGTKLAVDLTWPDAILFRCEEHLRKLMRKALLADGIPAKVTVPEAKRHGVKHDDRAAIKAVRRGTTPMRSHPLYSLVNRSFKSETDWAPMKIGIEGFIPNTRKKLLKRSQTNLRTWITTNEAMVMTQFDLKAKHPSMPKSAGGVEGTLDRIGKAIGKRSEFFANARRLELIVGLVRIESLGLANEVRYSQIIAQTILERDGAGMGWQNGRDISGTSSIDAMITDSMAPAAVSEVERQVDRRQAIQDKKTAAIDAERAVAGLPPTMTGKYRRPNGPAIAQPLVKHAKVSDIPEIDRYWRPDYNEGRLSSEVGSGHGKPATWVCDKHAGHLHIWKRRVIDMSTFRPSCPFCSHTRVCPETSLAGLHPKIAAEWAASNLPLTPDMVPDGSNREPMWIGPT